MPTQLFNPLRREEIIDPETSKIYPILVPSDITVDVNDTDVAVNPTGSQLNFASINAHLALFEVAGRIKTLEDAGAAIIGSHHTISGNLGGTDATIGQNITIPSGGNGTYEIEAKISYYLSNGTSNQIVSLVKNGNILTGVLVSDAFSNEVIGTHAHTLKYYLNSLVATDTISINVNTSSGGNVNDSVCQLTAKKLQNTVTITPTNDYGGGGV